MRPAMAWILPSTTATPMWSRWPTKGCVPVEPRIAGAVRIFVARRIVDLVPFHRAHVAAAEQMNLAVEHDRRDRAARARQAGDRRPLVGRRVIDETLRMRAAVLLDETAEGVNLGADRNAGDVIARMREHRLQRPRFRRRVIDLMKILIDAMLGIAGDAVDLAAALDHRMFAGRDRHARLLDPFAGIGGFRRHARHVALFLHRCRDRGDGLVVQPEKNRKLGFCHDTPSLPFTFAGDVVGAPADTRSRSRAGVRRHGVPQ